MALLAELERQEDYIAALQEHKGGFDFENHTRNLRLCKALTGKMQFPSAKKTGTTICGIICGDAVILGADTRATAGAIVADKKADKLHPIADNIACAGAGTSADLTHTTELIERQMLIHQLNTATQCRVVTVVRRLSKHLFNYQGHCGCHLVLGGYDVNGPHLYQISAHGNTDRLPFTTMGSGSLAAMAVMESRYKENMTIEEGKKLVADAISSGIFNDLGSGGNCDIMVITKEGRQHFPAFREENKKAYKATFPSFTSGSTMLIEKPPVFKKRETKDTDKDGDVKMA